MTSEMNERKRIVAELKRVKAALQTTQSDKLRRDYTKYQRRLQKRLEGV
jgi:hypothetical protein